MQKLEKMNNNFDYQTSTVDGARGFADMHAEPERCDYEPDYDDCDGEDYGDECNCSDPGCDCDNKYDDFDTKDDLWAAGYDGDM